MASKAHVPNSHRKYDLEADGITIIGHTPPRRSGANARDVANWTRNGGKSKDDPLIVDDDDDDDDEVQEIYETSSNRPGTSWQTATNPDMTNPTLGLATFQTTNSNPQVWSDPSTAPSTPAGTRNNSAKLVPRISSGSERASSSSLLGQTSAAPNGFFLTDSPRLPRKRKNTEPPNMSATVSKKQRVDVIDVNQLDGLQGLTLQTTHSFSNVNLVCQYNVRLEHAPNVGYSSSHTDLELPLAQAASTPSSSTSVTQEVWSTSIALAPQTPMPDSHRPNQSSTRSTPHVVPQPGHRTTGGNSFTFPIMQEAPKSTPRRHGRLSDLQINPPPTPKIIPKTGNIPNGIIDLCSSEDEDPMDSDLGDGGRYNQTEAQGFENIGPRTEGESDSDYWSICLSDDDREEPGQVLDLVGKVQQNHIQKKWIPPTSTERLRLRKPFEIASVCHVLHKQTSFYHTTLDLRTTLATGRIRTPRRKEGPLDTFLSPLRSDLIQKCAELTMGMGINYVVQSERRVFMATVPGRQASPALNVYDTTSKRTVPVEPDQVFVHPMHEIGVDPANPLRVLTTEYADWAEMDPNQADQKCVRIWDWEEVEDSDVGKFIEADSWEYDGRPMGIAFNPDRSTWRQEDDELSMCAIGCGSGQLMIHYSRKHRDRVDVVDPAHKQHVSSLVWGNGPTSNTLFAGTMEDQDSGFSGHIAVVSLRTDLITVMDRTQNIGEVDALGMSPQGDRLAACIRGQGLPSLEIYAVGNSGIQKSSKLSTRSTRHPSFDSSFSTSSSSAQARISLEAFDTQQAEVSFCKWSPCGTYIAVGRNDDRVDLFDSRFIKYGPVSRMVHGKPIKRTPWKVLWGITGLEWVEGAGQAQQALVSGGTDGCVRLWDIRHADPVCDILAEMEADVGSFSVGDIGKREAPLVVADSEGTVVVLSDIGTAKKAGYADW